MLINTDKTKVMFITSRQKRCNLNDASFHLKCNNIDLKLTTGDKILGANIDENLIWDLHYKYCYDIKPVRKEEGKSYWKIPLCDDDATREK